MVVLVKDTEHANKAEQQQKASTHIQQSRERQKKYFVAPHNISTHYNFFYSMIILYYTNNFDVPSV